MNQAANLVPNDALQEDNWQEAIAAELQKIYEVPDLWASWGSELTEQAGRALTKDDINALYDRLVLSLTNVKPGKRSSDSPKETAIRRKRPRRTTRGPPNRTQRRRYAFAKCQELMNKCPKKLADVVAANDLSLIQIRRAPGLKETKELYANLWGIPGPEQNKLCQTAPTAATGQIFFPVTPEEVNSKIKKIANTSAAGVDGLSKSDLKRKGVEVLLAKLFNILLFNEDFPLAWRINRTTLIPKAGKDTSNIKNWRPITIFSMISRVFTSLLDRRLRKVITQTERQKGFTEENGCFSNVHLLNSAISKAKEDGGIVTVLDVSKAFDTVPHSAIKVALERKGVPSLVADYVANSYKGCQTVIKTYDGELAIELKRGVKQGDPLSPILFNLIIEPIIESIQSKISGVNLEGHNLAALAFADDIVLLARDRGEALTQTRLVDDSLRSKGMSISAEKSSAFQFVPKNKTWHVRDPELLLRGIPIPYNEPGAAFKYLGVKFTPWKGLIEGTERETFKDIIGRVRILPIKPMQKIDLLRTYFLPRYTYGLIARPPSNEVLKEIDCTIREGAKRILHLHETTSSAFLYTPRKEGGLGLLEIRKVLLAALRNDVRAMQSSDLVRDSLANDQNSKKYAAYAAALRLPWPITIKQIDEHKARMRKAYRIEQPTQGQGVNDFAYEPISNAWLTQRHLMRSSRLIDAIKMRTNTYPTRMTMKRAHDDINPVCRSCVEANETLGHILGQCSSTKSKRIKRHNEIVNLLKQRLAGSCMVMVEPTIELQGERFKPDLVVQYKEGILVLDVTVRYENSNSLEAAAQEKIDKYERVADKLKSDYGAKTARIVPIVVGSRCALPKGTVQELKKMRIAKKDWLTMSLISFRSSIEIANAFMDA